MKGEDVHENTEETAVLRAELERSVLESTQERVRNFGEQLIRSADKEVFVHNEDHYNDEGTQNNNNNNSNFTNG